MAAFDSDVLVYDHLDRIQGLGNFDMLTGDIRWVGQIVFNNMAALDRYIEICEEVYRSF